MGRHTAQPEGRPHLTKVAGLAGMATSAAALAMTIGAGTAQAQPGDLLNKILHPSTSGSGATVKPAATTNAATGPDIGSILSSIAPSIYNPGPFTFGPVTTPKPPSGCGTPSTCTNIGGIFVKPATPGSQPFTSIQGIQLPFWSVRPGTGVPVPPA